MIIFAFNMFISGKSVVVIQSYGKQLKISLINFDKLET